MEPFAIVGFAFKLAQDAVDESSLWEVLENGKNLMTKWPEDRATIDTYHDGGSKKTATIHTQGAHFCNGDLASFDAPFFSINPQEAAVMDPQQRWALQTVYHAFENAGIPIESVKGSRTAVFGACSDDYSRMLTKDVDSAPRLVLTGTEASVLVGKISWYFNLAGPCLHINTACSSSLTALDYACKSMQSGDASAAVVLGSNLMLNPDAATLLSNLNFLSPDGLCYTFDHRANGYARGEGILAMIVKPMADALRDGNVIRAVIRATGANQDGRTPSLTQPSAEAQEKLIRHVYQKAGLGLQDTRYLEAHGTGTPTGDPIEAKAIGRVFRTHRSPQDPLYLGSIKGNIGHVEAGSGLAGTIRAILALEKGVIPPQALFEDMNSSIDAEFFNIKVPKACVPWPTAGVRRASVNSFSLGGSNAHIILDDAHHYLLNKGLTGYHNCTMLPDDSTAVAINGTTYSSSEHPEQQPSTTLSNGVSRTSPDAARTLSGSSPLLMVWSGADSGAIDRLTIVYEPYLQNKIRGSSRKLNQLAYTLSNRRSRLPWRSFTLLSADQIASGEGLVPLPKAKPVRSANYAPVIAFAFTGQGAQYAAMGLELLQYKIFADTLQRVDSVFASFGSTWSVLDVMRDENKIHSPQFSQPLCTALQIALVELLKSVCVAPSAVLGHSSGEIAAAYAIGALSLESACKVAYYRGIVAKKLKDSVAARPGAMMSVNLPRDEVRSYLYKVGGDKMVVSVHLACINSISNCTLSGDEKDIDQLKQRLDQDEIFAQKINTGVAYHSPAMKAAASEYHELLGGLESGTKLSRGSMISSVTRRLITKVSMLATAQYWVDNLLSPVQFADALQSLDSRENLGVGFERITDILEIGPHSALRRPIQDTLQHLADVGVNAKGKSTKPEGVLRYHSVLQRSKPSLITFLELLGNLFCIGYPVSIEEGNGHHGDKCPPPLVDCPKYPFDLSRRYWHNSRLDKGMRFRPVAKGVMLGKRSHDWNNLRPSFRNWLSLDTMPWLEDHVISTKTICPGTGMLVMAMEGVKHLIESNKVAKSISAFLFPEAHFLRPIPIPENAKTPVEILLSLRPRQETFEKEIAFFESSIFAHDGDSWTECFQATIQVQYEQGVTQVDGGKEHQAETDKYLKLQHEAANCCDKKIDYKTFYQSLRDHGMAYGPSFSILRDIRWDGQHISQACIAHDLMLDAGDASPVHPAPLDAMMHVTLAQVSKGMSDSAATFVPRDVYNLWLSTKRWKQGHGSVRATSKIHSNKTAGLEGNIFVCDEEDTLLLSAERVVMACVSLDDDGLRDNQGPNLIYNIDRKPLLSQLEGHDLQRLCAPRPISLTDIEQQWSNRLETALRHSAEDALGCLSSLNFDTSTLPNHLKTFIQALKSRYRDGRQHDKEEIRQELARCVEFNPGWDLYAEAGRHLESLLRNETEPLELLTSSEVANRSYPLLFSKLADDRLRNFLDLASHEKPGLRILEIGSGTGGLTTSVLSILRDLEKSTGSIHFAEYIYTDISPAFFEAARTTFAQVADRIVFQKLDIEKSPETQGFETGSYDIILAGSVLHATSRLEVSISNVRALLKPGGYFVNLEITQVNLAKALVSFGSLPGWWLSTEDWRKDGPLVPKETWDRLARDTGFTGVEASWEDGEGVCLMITTAVEKETSAEMPIQPAVRNQGSLILVVDTNAPDLQTTLAASLLQEQGQNTRVVQLNQVHENTWQHDDVIISLLDVGKSFLLAISEQEFDALRTLISKAQNLLWVALPDLLVEEDAGDPRPHMALGFLRSMRYEEPTKELVSLMAGQRTLLTVDAAEAHIRNVLRICFQDGLASLENEFFIQDGLLSVERLIYAADQDDDRRLRIYPTLQKDQILRHDPPTVLSVGTPGMLDTLRLAEAQLPDKLDPEAVEIECRAWPVSFRDVMIALSRYGDASDTSGMGWELSGVVSRVGSKVSELQPGDRVCGAAIAGMQTVVQVPVDMVFKIPDDMSFARSVAALNPLMTAYHGLINLARLKRGDKVLIHAAAGSTGQMAICVAQQVGAEIFATVGFDEKKQLLVDEFGIPASNIFYSRDTSFQKGIMRETGGRGVDVVLNSLSGDKLKASWACIAPFGRFIEIGKADIGSNSSLPMAHFARNVTFAAVDLVHMAARDPQGTKDLMRTCLAMLFESNIGQYPKPVHLFPVAEAEKAFRFIQSGKNTGRTVITLEPNDKISKYITKRSTWRFPSQATYVIVGGLGGIGRSILSWMVQKGARYFVIPSRSGVKSQAVAEFVARLEQKGVTLITSCCDVSSSDQLAALLQACKDMPPIRGCINAAMALQDAMFYNMTHSQWKISIQSKVASSWNLHQQLPADLDFFILLSSAASIYGAIGQSNYAAACAGQDSIARHRSSMGGKAMSINLGLIRNVGAMVDHEDFQVSSDKYRDAKAVYERDILAVMDYYCDPLTLTGKETHTQVLVGGATPSDTHIDTVLPPHIDGRPFYSGFPRITKEGQQRNQRNGANDQTALLFQQATSPTDRAAVAMGAIIDKLAHALCITSDEIDARNPLSDYGVDSLMAVELRHWFRRDFKADVAVFDIMGNNVSIRNVAELIARVAE